MKRNSLRNRPTPTAPALSAPTASSGCSMLASSSIFWPSSVTAGVFFRRESRSRSTSPWRCLKPYSASRMGDGSTTTTPASPSMMTQSSCSISWLAERAPTTAGMSMLRATMAVWLVLPPTSVTKPANTLCLNCSMSAGDRSCAISTSGTSTALSCAGALLASAHRGGHAAHHAQDAFDHLLQIGLALAQVGVFHFVELARDHLQLGGQRPFGVVVALDDPVLHAAGELLVLQQHEVHIEQGGEFGVGVRRPQLVQALLHLHDLRRHLVARMAQALDLAVDLLGLDEVVGHIDPARRHDHRPPDGNAPGDGETVDAEKLIHPRQTCR